MEQEFDNDFEGFLRNGADDYRMYPSERVWNGVYDRLHGKKRMFAIASVSLALLALLFIYRDNRNGTANLATSSQFRAPQDADQVSNAPLQRPAARTYGQDYLPGDVFPISQRPYSISATVITGDDIIAEEPVAEEAIAITDTDKYTDIPAVEANPVIVIETPRAPIENYFATQEFLDGLTDSDPIAETAPLTNDRERIPAAKKPAIEPATIAAFTPARKKKKNTSTEFYITPSISYRSLYDTRPERKLLGDSGNLDKSVFHRPGIGMEAGISWHRQIDNRLRFKAGFQLNYNRYNIKAAITQRAIAPIDLTGDNGNLTISSRYENRSDGVIPEWLENTNLQVSIPVGLEIAVAGNEKTQLNIGATMQPSYLIRDKSYLLSTDLKRYASNEDLKMNNNEAFLIRRFNLNAGVEAFLTFNTPRFRWHIGPQLRYQLFSSYNKVYPFKENLIDYGFKIGFSKIIP